MTNKAGIYFITCSVNNKFYIGSTNNLYRRKREHFNALYRGNCTNTHMQSSYNKYGKSTFEFSVFMEYDGCRDKLYDIERDLIIEHNTIDSTIGFNQLKDARCRISAGWVNRHEHPEKMRKYLSETHSGEKNGMFGKTHSDETRQAMSKAASLRTGELNSMFGKKHTDETRYKMSKSNKGSSKNTKREISINGILYIGMKSACDSLNIPNSTLYKRLNSNSIRFKDWYFVNINENRFNR